MQDKQAIESLSALMQESRLALCRLPVTRGPEGYAVGEIGERLGIPGATLSFHWKAHAAPLDNGVTSGSEIVSSTPEQRFALIHRHAPCQ